jgi:hypothetical protein
MATHRILYVSSGGEAKELFVEHIRSGRSGDLPKTETWSVAAR